MEVVILYILFILLYIYYSCNEFKIYEKYK